jgi:polysaccharide pyruvyl transferase WcaK-like protein
MKILLAGYYGFHNIGDDLLADTALAILKKNNYQVTVLTKAKRKIKKTITLLKECDILLFSGGSLFQDVTGRGLTVLYYFLLFQAAKIFQKKVFFIAQGIGPIKRPINYWLVKTCFKKVDYLTVRNK